MILAAAVPGPAGFAVLSQEIEPDDYRGRAITFRADLRTTGVADRAGLVLRIPRQGRRPASPGSLARSREPLRHRHRNPRLDPP